MNNENETKNLSVIHALLKDAGLEDGRKGELTISTLTGDGSSRKFWRTMNGEKRLCLAVAPPSLNDQDLAEAGAARSIGLHLLKRGVRVPRQYGWDRENGIILFEDFGDKNFMILSLGNRRLAVGLSVSDHIIQLLWKDLP